MKTSTTKEGKPPRLINAKHVQGAIAGLLVVALLFAGSAMLPNARAMLEYDADGAILFAGYPCYVGRGVGLAGDALAVGASGDWTAVLANDYALIENIYQADARRIITRGDIEKPGAFTTIITGRTESEVLSAVDVGGVKFTDGREAPLSFNGFRDAVNGASLPGHTLFGYATARSDYYGMGVADTYNRPVEIKKILRPGAKTAINDAAVSPEELFRQYGTHLVTSFTLGARMDMYLIYHGAEAVAEGVFKSAISAALTYVTASGEVELREDDARILENTTVTLGFNGGEEETTGEMSLSEARSRYASWYEGLTIENSSVSKLDRLIPIWDLADSDVRRSELYEEYLALLDERTKSLESGRTPPETYISELTLLSGSNEATVKRALRSRGYKVLDINLNQLSSTRDPILYFEGASQGVVNAYSARAGSGSLLTRNNLIWERPAAGTVKGLTRLDFKECIYLGYKTTTDPAEAITDIVGATGLPPGGTNVFDGIEYTTLNRNCNEYKTPNAYVFLPDDQFGEFIYNTALVDVITMHYTKDPAAGAPIRELSGASRYKSSFYADVPRICAPYSTPELSDEYGWSVVRCATSEEDEMQDFDGGIPLPWQIYYDVKLLDAASSASNTSRYVTVWVRR